MLDKQYRDVYKYIYFFNYKNEDVCVPVYYYDTKISSKHSEVGGCGGGGGGWTWASGFCWLLHLCTFVIVRAATIHFPMI